MATDEPPEGGELTDPLVRPKRRRAPVSPLGEAPEVPVFQAPGPAAKNPRAGGISLAKYEEMWTAYSAGTRSISGLMRACKVHEVTAKRAIEAGWPDRQWPALRERVKLIDKARAEAEAAVVLEKFREEVDEFYKARRRNLDAAGEMRKVLLAQVLKLQVVVPLASYVRYRRVRVLPVDAKGKPVVGAEPIEIDQTYVPAASVMLASRQAAQILRDLGTFERMWLEVGRGAPNAGAGAEGDADAPPIKPCTPEQMDWISEHGGELPEGVTDEQLLATFKFLSGQPQGSGK